MLDLGLPGAPSASIAIPTRGRCRHRDVALASVMPQARNAGAEMLVLRRVGRFVETINGRGAEEEWERRCSAVGGRIRYLADAGLDHHIVRRRCAIGIVLVAQTTGRLRETLAERRS
jgi:hypothetical protein